MTKKNVKRLTAMLLVITMTVALLCMGVYADPVNEATDTVTPEIQPTTEEPIVSDPVVVEPEQPSEQPISIDPQNDGKRVLTVIGDSIAAGYGLSDTPTNPANQINLRGPAIVDGSYPQILRDEAGYDVVNKDARESYTAINFLRMLDDDYDTELARPENYYLRWLSECTFFLPKMFSGIDDTQNLKNNIRNHIAESDDIIINLGNNDTFTMALLDIVLRTEYYAFGGAIQPALTALKGKFTPATTLTDIISAAGGTYADLFTKEEEYLQLFKKNMTRMLGVIRKINPTAKIYYLGMYNTFACAEPENDALRDFLFQAGEDLASKLKAFATQECPYKDELTYVDVLGAETWKAYNLYNPLYWIQFIVLCHPNYEGHRFIAERLMAAMGKGGSSGGNHSNCPLLRFIDLNASNWYHEPIEYVLNNGIMNGMTENTFAPEATLTRAMVVTMLYALDGKPPVGNANSFSDVTEEDWFINPVIWAAQVGVVAGYDDGTFRPSNAVTREELATMLRSYAGYKSKDISASGNLSAFTDQGVVSAWATDNVSWAVGHGIINGRDGNMIAPRGTATRAEAATMFARLCQNVLK